MTRMFQSALAVAAFVALLGPSGGCAAAEKPAKGAKAAAVERGGRTSGSGPEWISTGKHARYPESAFLFAVGAAPSTGRRADDSARADESARAELAKTIRVSVQSIFTDIMKSATTHTADGPKGKSEQFTEYIARSEVKLQLEFAQIAERYYDRDEKIYYALAVLDRQRAAESLARQAVKGRETTNKYLEQAREAKAQGDLGMAIRDYFRALAELVPALERESEFRAVRTATTPEPTLPPAPSLAEITREIEQTLTGVSLAVDNGDNQMGLLRAPLPQPLTVRAVFKQEDTEFPIRKFPVTFALLDGTGDLQSEVLTDEHGLATCRVGRVDPSGKEFNRVSAELAFAKFYPDAAKLIPVTTQLTFRLPTKQTTTVFIKVFESIGATPVPNSFIQNAITEALGPRGAGFQVYDESTALKKVDLTTLDTSDDRELIQALGDLAQVIVIGNANSSLRQKVPTAEGDLVFNQTRVTLRAVDVGTGKVLLSMDPPTRKMSGATEMDAGRKAFEAIGKEVAKELANKLSEPFMVPASAPRGK